MCCDEEVEVGVGKSRFVMCAVEGREEEELELEAVIAKVEEKVSFRIDVCVRTRRRLTYLSKLQGFAATYLIQKLFFAVFPAVQANPFSARHSMTNRRTQSDRANQDNNANPATKSS